MGDENKIIVLGDDGMFYSRFEDSKDLEPLTLEEVTELAKNIKLDYNKALDEIDKLEEELNQRKDSETDPLGDLT